METERIYNKIIDLMKLKGLTEYALCQEAGVSTNTFTNWRNRPNISLPTYGVLSAICEVLGTNVSQIFVDIFDSNLTDEQMELINLWNLLDREQRQHLLTLLKSMIK